MATLSAAAVRAVVLPVVEGTGTDLEDVTISPAGRRSIVRVVVDRDGGLDLDALAETSRTVSEALDAATTLGEAPYVLEVTSPGVDRPLTAARHWRRNVGRLVAVDGVTGRVLAADEQTVTLQVDGVTRQLAMDGIGAGRVQVEFRHVDGAADSDEGDASTDAADVADDTTAVDGS